MGAHAWIRWQAGPPQPLPDEWPSVPPGGVLNYASAPVPRPVEVIDYRKHALYKIVVIWCLVTPLLWTIEGAPDFVTLTLTANSAQVVLLPLLAGGLWWITANSRYIGRKYRNSWWENALMAILFSLAIWGAYQSVSNIVAAFR
jgi:hypothetical protein